MRMRIIAASAALGLMGLVAIAPAQQGGEVRRANQGELRGRVAGLRAEVELLELEHGVDADLLKKLMTDVKNLEGSRALSAPMKAEVAALKETIKPRMPIIPLLPPGALAEMMKSAEEEFDDASKLDEATVKVARPLLDRMKDDFLKKAAGLNEKRLELAEVEGLYNATR